MIEEEGYEPPKELGAKRPSTIGRRSSTGLIVGVLALGLLIGYAMGWISFQSPWAVDSTPPALFDEELVSSLVEEASRAVVEISVTRRTQNPAV